MRTNLVLIGLLGLAILPCAGQSSGAGSKAGSPVLDKFDFGLTFTEKYAKIVNTTGTYFNIPGGSFDIAYNLPQVKRLVIAADIQGETSTQPITLGYGLSQISFVAGPRYTVWRQKCDGPKANIYGQALFGGVRAWNSLFLTTTSAPTSAFSFAFQGGGGVNIPFTKKVGMRVVEVDYILTKLPNLTNNYQGDVRFSTGLTYHF